MQQNSLDKLSSYYESVLILEFEVILKGNEKISNYFDDPIGLGQKNFNYVFLSCFHSIFAQTKQ